MWVNVLPLQEVANYVTGYFPLNMNIIAMQERDATKYFAISCNGCWQIGFLFIVFPYFRRNII